MVLCRQLAGLLNSIMRQERSYLIYGCNEVGVAVARLLRESENRLGGRFVGFIDEGRNQFANQPFCKSTFRDLREEPVRTRTLWSTASSLQCRMPLWKKLHASVADYSKIKTCSLPPLSQCSPSGGQLSKTPALPIATCWE